MSSTVVLTRAAVPALPAGFARGERRGRAQVSARTGRGATVVATRRGERTIRRLSPWCRRNVAKIMGWVWWLLAPLAVTSAVAVLTWFAGRPRRSPTSEQAVSAHRRFLDDLADASAPAHRARSGAGPADSHPASASPASASPASGTTRPDKLPG